MSLLGEFLILVEDWRSVFPQARTLRRGVRQALGSRVCLGRRCLTRIIWTNGGQNRSWSAEYFLHSRCQWEPQRLFQPILQHALAYWSREVFARAGSQGRQPRLSNHPDLLWREAPQDPL